MTIDISQLSPEKRAFLMVNPELLKSLEQVIPRQVSRVKKRQEKLRKGKSKLQCDLEDITKKEREPRAEAERLRKKFGRLKRKATSKDQKEMAELKRKMREYEFRLDPNLRKLQRKLMERQDVIREDKELVCPKCGEAWNKSEANRMNGKPWCLKCDSPLVPKEQVAKWKEMLKIKSVRDTLKDEFKRRELDF